MKKIILIVFMLCITALTFAFSKPSKLEDNVTEVTGFVNVYGNEPFTFIGIVTDKNEQYSIKADQETLNDLRKTQGQKIEIKGTIYKYEDISLNQLKDGNLIVIEWKLAK